MISTTVFLPAFTAAIVLVLPRASTNEPGVEPARLEHRVALLGALVTLVFVIAQLLVLQVLDALPLIERHQWIPALGVTLSFRVDGINVFPYITTALVTCVAILSSRQQAVDRGRLLVVITLLLETCCLGAWTALDAVLLVVFLQGAITCAVALLLVSGKTERTRGARQLALCMSTGATALFLTVLYAQASLIERGAAPDLAAPPEVTSTAAAAPALRWLFLVVGVTGCGLLVAQFPAHRPLSNACRDSAPPTDLLLAGLLAIGTYCLIRIVLPLFPEAAIQAGPWLISLVIVGVLVAAIGSFLETDARCLIYRFSAVQIGLALAGLLSFTVEGVVGSLVLLVHHGLAATGLYYLLGALGRRRLSQRIGETRALSGSAPRFARVLIIVVGCAVGIIPATGLVGVYLIASGLLASGHWLVATLGLAGLLAVSVSLVVYCSGLLLPYRKAVPRHVRASDTVAPPPDLGRRELMTILPVAALMVAGGVFSSWLTGRITPMVQQWLEAFR